MWGRFKETVSHCTRIFQHIIVYFHRLSNTTLGNIFTRIIRSLSFGPWKSSVPSTFTCGICVSQTPFIKYFAIKGCIHSYCSDCVCEYVTSKIQDKITRISCPVSGCDGTLDPEYCRSILAPEVFDKWGDELCEACKSSVSSTFMCGICVDLKPIKKSFAIKGCDHSYCSDCVCQYVTSKIQDKITRISCPVSGCDGTLDPEYCRSILAPEVFNKWGDELCEACKSSVSSTFMCGICVDLKPIKKSFAIKGCDHSYCSDCVCQYVTSKIQDKITCISCPVSGCNGSLDPEHCCSILAPKVLDKWGDELCEALISAPNRFYCPFKDCSALLIKGCDFKKIVESECPNCHKLFCAQCMVPWHSGLKCRKFQKLHKERKRNDLLLDQLAKTKRWRRCSKCKLYVERTAGCLFMRCRCGNTFCHNCGARLTSHYCKKCKH